MTYVLPMSAIAVTRVRRPLQMQFAAPILAAEAYGFEVAPVVPRRMRAADLERHEDIGVPSGLAFVLAIPLGLMIWSGAIYWVLA
ncbi:hypothetical protein ACTTAI_08895 [Rhodobacter capsulatus]|uniref:hypothetical protein n=1 Tax=Rhodobacter capsulatus TaxID=1061 RepID=UPI0040284EE2